ncbi:MAG: tetratricopeptide repeat protein [Planctomycetota bacterium]|jgi:tetratricopeptide (TPR) repeat protein
MTASENPNPEEVEEEATPPPEAPSPPSKKDLAPRPRWRTWIFRLTSIFLGPLLFFGSIEGCLRVVGYGHSTRFFIRHPDQEAVMGNPRFGLRFFPPALVREPLPLSFPPKKAEGTVRIFVLGGSAARGEPDPAFGFSRILEVMLEDRFPGVRFEVINTAMTAINSHVVLPIARDCTRFHPDVFVVYLGNNEVVGPYGAGTIFKGYSPSLRVIRTGIWVKTTKTGQLIESILRGVWGAEEKFKEWKGMEMFLEHRIPAGDPRLKRVHRHFRRNLAAILDVCRGSGAPVMVCTVATNIRDNAPFASMHRKDLSEEDRATWDRIYAEGVALEGKGDFKSAAAKFREAAGIDDRVADLHFRLGRCLWALKDFVESRGHFLQARELDALRFRADSRINRIIRDVGSGRESEGIHLADVKTAFDGASPHATAGGEFFHEHVHLNFAGNYALAREVFQKAIAVLPERVRTSERGEKAICSRESCAERLALTGLNRFRIAMNLRRITSKPPFTNQLNFPERNARWEEELIALEKKYFTEEGKRDACEAYCKAVAREPDDLYFREGYAALLEDTRRWTESAEQWDFLLQRIPGQDFWKRGAAKSRLEMGNQKFSEGNSEAAMALFREALEIQPGFSKAHYNLGFLHASQWNLEEAIREYRKALEAEPGFALAHNGLGQALAKQGNKEESIKAYERALACDPDLFYAHLNLGGALTERGEIKEGIGHYLHALRLDPGNPAVSEGLFRVAWHLATHEDAGERNGAEALRIAQKICQAPGGMRPSFYALHAAAQAENGRFHEAVRTGEFALKLAKEVNNPDLARALEGHLIQYRAGKPVREAWRE